MGGERQKKSNWKADRDTMIGKGRKQVSSSHGLLHGSLHGLQVVRGDFVYFYFRGKYSVPAIFQNRRINIRTCQFMW